LPIVYESKTGKIVNSPVSGAKVDASAVFVIVQEGNIIKDADVASLLVS
jgi:hypothetical protein